MRADQGAPDRLDLAGREWTITLCGVCGRLLLAGDERFHLHDAHPETRTQIDRVGLIRYVTVVPKGSPADEPSEEER